MDFLGVADEVTSEGRIIVLGVVAPEMGDPVFDAKQKRIGTVKRVFGPVDGPYVSVTPADKTVLTNISGKKIYFEGAVSYGKNKRRN